MHGTRTTLPVRQERADAAHVLTDMEQLPEVLAT